MNEKYYLLTLGEFSPDIFMESSDEYGNPNILKIFDGDSWSEIDDLYVIYGDHLRIESIADFIACQSEVYRFDYDEITELEVAKFIMINELNK